MGRYFTMDELTKTSYQVENTPTQSAIQALQRLIERVLDPLREAWGIPIYINSGYRSPQLNTLVGGAKSSQHMLGEAADITAGSPAQNRKLFEKIENLRLDFDQLIDESNYQWLHISYREGRNRNQILHL